MLANDEFEQHIEPNSKFNNIWKHYLYELQLTAPKPKRVVCPNQVENKVLIFLKNNF